MTNLTSKIKVQELESTEDIGALIEKKDWIIYHGRPVLYWDSKCNGIELITARETYHLYEKEFVLTKDLEVVNGGIKTNGLVIQTRISKQEYDKAIRRLA
ncbi:MAG: hypothetical protein AABW47_04965 [Nanoarchaeota archaeon]